MKKVILVSAVLLAVGLAAVSSHAKGQSARVKCLARAGVTEQQWQERRASFAQGAIMKACMAEHGQDIKVRRQDGSVLY